MFIYYFAHLNLPFEEVDDRVHRLFDDLSGWAAATYRHGEELRGRVGLSGSGGLVAKTVTMDVGRPVRSESQTTIPLAWHATGATGMFPRMSADLIIARMAPDLTQLGFSGSYEAPGGPVGQAVDGALLHRIAESTVKNFVDQIADAVGNDAPEMAGRQPTGRD